MSEKTIVIARVDPEGGAATVARRDRYGTPVEFKYAPAARAAIWLNRGDKSDIAKARRHAEKEGYVVFTYPTSEKDPLGRAKREIMRRYRSRRRNTSVHKARLRRKAAYSPESAHSWRSPRGAHAEFDMALHELGWSGASVRSGADSRAHRKRVRRAKVLARKRGIGRRAAEQMIQWGYEDAGRPRRRIVRRNPRWPSWLIKKTEAWDAAGDPSSAELEKVIKRLWRDKSLSRDDKEMVTEALLFDYERKANPQKRAKRRYRHLLTSVQLANMPNAQLKRRYDSLWAKLKRPKHPRAKKMLDEALRQLEKEARFRSRSGDEWEILGRLK